MLKVRTQKSRLARLPVALVAGLTIASAVALAQEMATIRPVTEHGITYLSGGVGEEEVSGMRAMAPKFNLHLVFAQKSGVYLADVDVVIFSPSGQQVAAMKSEGPLLFVSLPPGRYRVTATSDTVNVTHWVTVPAHGGADINFYWG
ncbi:hypothetical protein B0G57_103138 [Trinickia symbiotica]|nr:hypothetical protein B0G57_103138 [Trinickia symbiotica]